ncbi:MAG: HAD hydrolase-like protein, partial [Methyloceanibacter sp.]
RLVYCAGALAALYEKVGGSVVYAGKPHAPIYALALETIAQLAGGSVAKDAVRAIGDGINTDIAGAASLGIDAVFVASGLHVPSAPGGETDETLDGLDLAELFAHAKRRPLGAMRALSW